MSRSQPIILIVDDEASIGNLLKLNLELDGFQTLICDRGDEAIEIIKSQNVHLILLDVMLPGKNGIEICREINQIRPETPIIMLSALGQSSDKIAGLKAGADDYMGKPFNYEELHLRILKQLEKNRTQLGAKKIIELNGLQINFTTNKILISDTLTKDMNHKESALLLYLIENKNRVISRKEILANVWGYDNFPNSRTVDNHIASLRKLLSYGSDDNPIRSERGVGYQLVF